jgi:hypothetical protein
VDNTTATIDRTTGAFTWTPTAAGTSTITVSVEDEPTNGGIPRSDEESFTVTVTTDSLAAQSSSGEGTFVAGGDTVTLTWDSIVGTSYKIQSKAVNAADWSDVQAVTASDSSTSVTVTNNGNDAYYRIVAVESGASDE